MQETTTNEQAFTCPFKDCYEKKVSYTTRDDLCNHLNTDHKCGSPTGLQPSSQHAHKCDICTYSTQVLDDMVIHKKKNHECGWCEYSSAFDYRILRGHVISRHYCDSCYKYFPSLKQHQNEVHDCTIS